MNRSKVTSKNTKLAMRIFVISYVCLLSAFVVNSHAQTTEFSYQGLLKASGAPATGNYDFEFKLFDAASGGAQVGSTVQRLNVAVANGNYAVSLDFGAGGLTGADRYLDIAVRTAGGGTFTPLTPRQKILATPYAVRSLNAATADTVIVGGVPAGSGNYIQNTTSPQVSSNFNVSGTGKAGVFDATTQFNIGGSRVLSNAGSGNLFAGQGTGSLGSNNAFFGSSAGTSATSFSGSNSFFGSGAGLSNADGGNNAFFGAGAGSNNSGPIANANTFIGSSAGSGNVTGRLNTLLGFSANMPFGSGLINATAIGGRAYVTQNNSLVLGSINGVNGATADTNVGIGTTAPVGNLHVNVPGSGTPISAFTVDVGTFGTGGNAAASYFFKARDVGGGSTPAFLIRGDGNVGINTANPTERLDVAGNIKFSGTIIGDGSGLTNVTAGQTITNLSNLVTLRWDLLRSQRTFTPGIQPYGIAFDGANMWVVEFNGSTVKKIRASDGAVIGTFAVGSSLRFIAFDGANMWVTSTTPGATVIKVRASDGAVLNTFSTPTGASNLAYDGENMWVLNGSSVTKMRVSDGANLGNFTAGSSPSGIAFDGASMWITHLGSDGLRKVNAADGTSVNYLMATGGGVTFDGNNIWLSNTTAGSVVRIRLLDGAILNSYTVAAGTNKIAFDGSNLWVMNSDATSGTATKIRAADGAILASFALGAVPIDIAFDGTNMWVTNTNSGTVIRLAPAFPNP